MSVVCVLAVVGVAGASLYEYTAEELEGPEQPIEFSHRVHAGDMGIECLYCHGPAAKSQHATVPAVSTCMGCHAYVSSRGEGTEEQKAKSTAEIQKLRDYAAKGESIPWVRVHGLPEYVQFKHFRHIEAGVECQECHGPVEELNRVYLVPDTVLRPHSLWLPAAKLEMGWCMDCHFDRGAADDCSACHY